MAAMPATEPHDPHRTPNGQFASTHWSVVLAAAQTSSPEAEAALEKLCVAYWYPLYAYLRRSGHSPSLACGDGSDVGARDQQRPTRELRRARGTA